MYKMQDVNELEQNFRELGIAIVQLFCTKNSDKFIFVTSIKFIYLSLFWYFFMLNFILNTDGL